MKIKLYYLPIFYIYTVQCFATKVTPISLHSIFFHKVDAYVDHIELGTMVMFFSAMATPILIDKKEDSRGFMTERFIIPHVKMSHEQLQKINNIRCCSPEVVYQIECSSVKNPVECVELLIKYNARSVGFYYEKVVSSTVHHGYMFRFINKNIEKKINQYVDKASVTKIASLKKKVRIVIDPGHGGGDTGAVSQSGFEEKKIVLYISKKVRHMLLNKGFDTLMTRTVDSFLSLDERTKLSNDVGATIFVSIHANAAHNKNAYGIETFFYPYDRSTLVGGDTHITNQLQNYWQLKTMNASLLAREIQEKLCHAVQVVHPFPSAIDRKVKSAPFQVLLGSQAPSVLVEVGFLSHCDESKLLSSGSYCTRLAQGIADGIVSFVHKQL